MLLELGPVPLKTTFSFDIDECIKESKRSIDSIGVYLSAGIDSAALLVLILTELKNTNRLDSMPITCYTIDKQDYAVDNTPKILDIINNKFGVNINHQNNIPNSSRDNITFKTSSDLYKRNKKSIFFAGINKMPSDNIVKFKYKLKIDYGTSKKNKILYYAPFLLLHKPQILDILYKLNCEDILPYTYSCTMNEKIPCNNCYSCEERKWGFKLLNKQDPIFSTLLDSN